MPVTTWPVPHEHRLSRVDELHPGPFLVAFVSTVQVIAAVGVHPDGYATRFDRAALSRITVTAGLAAAGLIALHLAN